MSQPAVAALTPLPFELVYDDGEPLETRWHWLQTHLLNAVIRSAMAEHGRTDFFSGGNMFVYYSVEQAREVAQEETEGGMKRAYRGPDVFWVGGVDPARDRQIWIAWEEGGRLPDLIVELLSPSTAKVVRITKKELYAQVFRTAEYYMYDPDRHLLEGFRLAQGSYRPLRPDRERRLWSEQLGCFLGSWQGEWEGMNATWIRLFRPDGSLVPTKAEAEHQRAEAERQRAEAAEAELSRLRALLAQKPQS